MRTLLAALTALMLFAATPVVAGEVDDEEAVLGAYLTHPFRND